MCGINGIVRLDPEAPAVDRAELLRVRDAQAVRGPDGSGEWIAADGGAGLAHRRLAILDLSPAGAQPMVWNGRYVLVFNGEIYNFRQLRAELAAAGVELKSQSDTEVILALYERHGAAMLPMLRGMYALAIWDDARRSLFLARDPYGIKPLYYAVTQGFLRFASQVRALEASGAVSMEPDPAGVAGFLLWGSVPEPWTIRREVKSLSAGCWLVVEKGRVGEPQRHHRVGEPQRHHRVGEPQRGDEEPPAAALAASVEAHLVSDVPVGIFLSAGVDSALVAALARRALPEPPATFTLVFDRFRGSADDEGPLAAEIARALGTRHTEASFGHEDLAELWPQAVSAMDQPSIDGFNTFAVSRLAAQAGFKVALSGLGGDEIFGSYPSFTDVPSWVRRAAPGRAFPPLGPLFRPAARILFPGRPKLAGLMTYARTLPGAYFLRRGLFLPEELPRLLGREKAEEALAAYDPVAQAEEIAASAPDDWQAIHRLESSLYLRNQLLRDADWAAMASSLELRVPFVDTRLLAALTAADFEPARSRGKATWARELAPELPLAVFERPKSGFAIPVLDAVETGSSHRSKGMQSRRLALRLLEVFGI